MIRNNRFAALLVPIAIVVAASIPAASQTITTLPNSYLPRKDDKTFLPDEWLLSTGQPWHYRTTASGNGAPIGQRPPTPSETRVVMDAKGLVEAYGIKVIALLEGGDVVDIVARPNVGLNTLLLSASMGKTVTAVAVGKAICEGRLQLDTRADAVVPLLRGRDLGAATLRQLMQMSSGVTEPPPRDATGITRDEVERYVQGTESLEALVASPRVSTAQGIGGKKYRPGERFSYKSIDPFTVAEMLQYAAQMPAARWVDRKLLADIPIGNQAILGTNQRGDFVGAEGGIRMSLQDWIRFAAYVQRQRILDGCFGAYLKEMSRTQIKIPMIDGINGYFAGYGFFTWTDNTLAKNTFWAVGYGGQRIGWSTNPAVRRMFLMFSNSADKDMNAIYPVADRWINGQQ
mgnify:CR=1 FL=1